MSQYKITLKLTFDFRKFNWSQEVRDQCRNLPSVGPIRGEISLHKQRCINKLSYSC
jgi:hypothetical protein